MNLAITLIACLMIADSLFALLNISKVKSILHKAFPNLDIKKVAIIEGVAGAIIILVKVITQTVM